LLVLGYRQKKKEKQLKQLQEAALNKIKLSKNEKQ